MSEPVLKCENIERYFLANLYFFKKWTIPSLFFFYFRLFNTQLTVNKCSI